MLHSLYACPKCATHRATFMGSLWGKGGQYASRVAIILSLALHLGSKAVYVSSGQLMHQGVCVCICTPRARVAWIAFGKVREGAVSTRWEFIFVEGCVVAVLLTLDTFSGSGLD